MPQNRDMSRREKVVATFIGNVCHADTPEIARLMAFCVGRVMLKRPSEGNPVEHDDHDKARHVRDWLVAAVNSEAPWLSNVDQMGRPKKLMKFSKIDDVVREADKVMLVEAGKHVGAVLSNDDESIEMELRDGFRVVRLLTPAALDRESAQMQHCVGAGGYDGFLNRPGYAIYSLRDRQDKAHVTLEIVGNEARQIQGKQNELPLKRYLDALAPFLVARGIDLDSHGCLKGQYVLSADGEFVDTADLRGVSVIRGNLVVSGRSILMPQTLVVKGSVHLSKCEFPEGLPKSIVTEGYFALRSCHPVVLPRSVTSGGHVTVKSCTVEGQMEECVAAEFVSFEDSSVRELPPVLRFHGDLNLRNTEVSDLGNVREIAGSLTIELAEITALPDNMRIGRNLSANGSKLATYPVTAAIGGHVDVSNTAITVLPSVSVIGTLNVSYTKIREIPAGLSANRMMAMGLNLDHLDPSISIAENLHLGRSWVRLKPGLTVGGTLNLESARVHRIPERITAAAIMASGAELKHLAANIVVAGDMDVSDTEIETLPLGMKVGGHILARNTYLSSLPEGFTTNANLDLTASEILRLPARMVVGGSLILHETEIAELPDDLVVGEDLVVTHTELAEVPSSVVVHGTVHCDPIGVRGDRDASRAASLG